MEGGADAVPRRLRELSEAVLAATSVEDVVDAFLAAARALLAVDGVHLIEVSEDAAVGHARAIAYEAGGLREDAYVIVLDERPSGTTRVVATGKAEHVPDARASTALRADYRERYGVRSALFVPLSWGGDVRWVTLLARTRKAPFSDEHIELASIMANVAAAGLALVEARDHQASSHDRDAALARAAAALNAPLDLDAVLRTVTREADLAVGGDMAGVYLGDGVSGGVATAGHNTPEGWEGYLMRPGEGLGGQVLQSGVAAVTNAYQRDVRIPDSPALRDLQTAVAVPMVWDGALRGALSIGWVRMRRVTPADLRTLEAFADLATVACRNAEAFEQVPAPSRRDALTGMLDHGALQARVRAEVARAESGGRPPACIAVALTGFEAINARLGHVRADKVLRRVAMALKAACGPATLLARYGGDQFVVLAPGLSAAQADVLAAQLRAAVADAADECPVSARTGVAVWTPGMRPVHLLDAAVAAARDAG